LRVVEASTWLNDLNSRSMRSGGMPMPVSFTEKWSSYWHLLAQEGAGL
jgi:hypothetical protein